MYKIVIEGGYKLKGEVKVSGAKNAVLAILPATLLADSPSVLENVPNLTDVRTMLDVLRFIGADVEVRKESVKIMPRFKTYKAPYELMKTMRASFYIAGPLLARLGRAEVPLPGGCVIGTRPVDFHIQGFQTMGAHVSLEHGYMKAKVKKLKAATLSLDPRWCSVGTTINLMMAAVLANGTTVIENAAKDPEVVDLAHFLIKMGAEIKGAGTRTIEVRGVKCLKGAVHRVIPDRIEAGTFLAAGAITAGDITVDGVPTGFLETVLVKLKEMGCEIRRDISRARVLGQQRFKCADITTAPYPGFPTDMQPSMVAILSKARGTSVVEETIHDSRFRYVDELRRMGADIRMKDNMALIHGEDHLTGAPVEASDLRAGSALILAGLCAEGQTEVYGVEYIDRGYENIEGKLTKLGAKIKRVNDER